MQSSKFIDIWGWCGTVAVLGAYALVSFGIMSAGGLTYQLLNITGALGIGAVSFNRGAYQSVVVNAIWAVIGLFAIIKILF